MATQITTAENNDEQECSSDSEGYKTFYINEIPGNAPHMKELGSTWKTTYESPFGSTSNSTLSSVGRHVTGSSSYSQSVSQAAMNPGGHVSPYVPNFSSTINGNAYYSGNSTESLTMEDETLTNALIPRAPPVASYTHQPLCGVNPPPTYPAMEGRYFAGGGGSSSFPQQPSHAQQWQWPHQYQYAPAPPQSPPAQNNMDRPVPPARYGSPTQPNPYYCYNNSVNVYVSARGAQSGNASHFQNQPQTYNANYYSQGYGPPPQRYYEAASSESNYRTPHSNPMQNYHNYPTTGSTTYNEGMTATVPPILSQNNSSYGTTDNTQFTVSIPGGQTLFRIPLLNQNEQPKSSGSSSYVASLIASDTKDGPKYRRNKGSHLKLSQGSPVYNPSLSSTQSTCAPVLPITGKRLSEEDSDLEMVSIFQPSSTAVAPKIPPPPKRKYTRRAENSGNGARGAPGPAKGKRKSKTAQVLVPNNNGECSVIGSNSNTTWNTTAHVGNHAQLAPIPRIPAKSVCEAGPIRKPRGMSNLRRASANKCETPIGIKRVSAFTKVFAPQRRQPKTVEKISMIETGSTQENNAQGALIPGSEIEHGQVVNPLVIPENLVENMHGDEKLSLVVSGAMQDHTQDHKELNEFLSSQLEETNFPSLPVVEDANVSVPEDANVAVSQDANVSVNDEDDDAFTAAADTATCDVNLPPATGIETAKLILDMPIIVDIPTKTNIEIHKQVKSKIIETLSDSDSDGESASDEESVKKKEETIPPVTPKGNKSPKSCKNDDPDPATTHVTTQVSKKGPYSNSPFLSLSSSSDDSDSDTTTDSESDSSKNDSISKGVTNSATKECTPSDPSTIPEKNSTESINISPAIKANELAEIPSHNETRSNGIHSHTNNDNTPHVLSDNNVKQLVGHDGTDCSSISDVVVSSPSGETLANDEFSLNKSKTPGQSTPGVELTDERRTSPHEPNGHISPSDMNQDDNTEYNVENRRYSLFSPEPDNDVTTNTNDANYNAWLDSCNMVDGTEPETLIFNSRVYPSDTPMTQMGAQTSATSINQTIFHQNLSNPDMGHTSTTCQDISTGGIDYQSQSQINDLGESQSTPGSENCAIRTMPHGVRYVGLLMPYYPEHTDYNPEGNQFDCGYEDPNSIQTSDPSEQLFYDYEYDDNDQDVPLDLTYLAQGQPTAHHISIQPHCPTGHDVMHSGFYTTLGPYSHLQNCIPCDDPQNVGILPISSPPIPPIPNPTLPPNSQESQIQRNNLNTACTGQPVNTSSTPAAATRGESSTTNSNKPAYSSSHYKTGRGTRRIVPRPVHTRRSLKWPKRYSHIKKNNPPKKPADIHNNIQVKGKVNQEPAGAIRFKNSSSKYSVIRLAQSRLNTMKSLRKNKRKAIKTQLINDMGIVFALGERAKSCQGSSKSATTIRKPVAPSPNHLKMQKYKKLSAKPTNSQVRRTRNNKRVSNKEPNRVSDCHSSNTDDFLEAHSKTSVTASASASTAVVPKQRVMARDSDDSDTDILTIHAEEDTSLDF